MVVKRRYSDAEVIQAVTEAKSLRQVLCRLGLTPKGGNYATIRRVIQQLGLSTSHFDVTVWTGHSAYVPAMNYITEGREIKSSDLKRKLIAEGIFAPKCSSCGGATWLGGPMPLELDHIDGDHANNALPNLRLLCPNCHALTPTHRGRNVKSNRRVVLLCTCGKPLSRRAHTCRVCHMARLHAATRPTKIVWPSADEFQSLVATHSNVRLGELLGVSDVAVAKHRKRLGI